jgi:hypothetical protein
MRLRLASEVSAARFDRSQCRRDDLLEVLNRVGILDTDRRVRLTVSRGFSLVHVALVVLGGSELPTHTDAKRPSILRDRILPKRIGRRIGVRRVEQVAAATGQLDGRAQRDDHREIDRDERIERLPSEGLPAAERLHLK